MKMKMKIFINNFDEIKKKVYFVDRNKKFFFFGREVGNYVIRYFRQNFLLKKNM